VDLFLFPHQDDEYFVAPMLARDPSRARCVFLTAGGYHGAGTAVRNGESSRALRSLGVPADCIVPAGEGPGVPDNALAAHLPAVFGWLLAEQAAGVERVIVPAWEGGHPDHDAACLLGHALAADSGGLPVCEFAAYRAHPVVPYFYTVMKPLPSRTAEAGPGSADRFSPANFALFRYYPSQWKTWLGLLPPLLCNFLAGGKTGIYEARRRDFGLRPHEGKLYYEYRGWNTFDRFLAQTGEFRRAHPDFP
jgi:LmbE family N-acetylglucosaminyl deacetylase